MIKITPFSRMVWKEDYQDNARILQQWIAECNRAELLTVINKIRDCGIYSVDAAKYQEERLGCNKKGLMFLPIYPPSEESSSIECVVSCSEKKAQELTDCLQSGKTDCITRVGELLGYPLCCVSFMDKYFKTKGVMDPIFIAAKKNRGDTVSKKNRPSSREASLRAKAEIVSINIPPEINVILRNFGIKAIPHIPCSSACKKSWELSKKFLKFIPHKNNLLKFLSEPMIWDEYKGVVIIDTNWFQAATHSYVSRDENSHHIINFNSKSMKTAVLN